MAALKASFRIYQTWDPPLYLSAAWPCAVVTSQRLPVISQFWQLWFPAFLRCKIASVLYFHLFIKTKWSPLLILFHIFTHLYKHNTCLFEGVLRLPTTYDNHPIQPTQCHPIHLAISGYFWLFLAISDYFWLFLTISGFKLIQVSPQWQGRGRHGGQGEG